MSDILIIGGGVIGLSIAYELAQAQRQVRLIDRGRVGREASWAGAGILPPAATRKDVPAWERLQAMSYGLHESLSRKLLNETGIDNGFRICGGIHLARKPGEAAALRADMLKLADDGVAVRELSGGEIVQLEPSMAAAVARGNIRAAFHLPDEAQIRNPRHLAALAAACRKLGVVIDENVSATDFEIVGDRVVGVATTAGRVLASDICLTAGAWSEALMRRLGLELSVYPVRGQMILYRCAQPPATHVIDEGPRYLVPRDDGRVLVGSTEEDVGFDKNTTDEGLAELSQFAREILPPLAEAKIEQTWAGLRPHGVDGFPYLGRAGGLANCYVAAGHYRSGLYTSPGTAVLMRQLICGETLASDIEQFRLDR